MTKVFVDGSSGTTGLRIFERLQSRKDIEFLTLSEERRKDTNARKDALNSADVAILCLPDLAAVEAVSLVENASTALIDTSTAHRTNASWVYGFSELGLKSRIAASKRVANPGCHASGFVALISPLVKSGILDANSLLSCFSLTGYTGGGKAMIAEYESALGEATFKEMSNLPLPLASPRVYALAQSHKHIPEMKKVCGLFHAPLFFPAVAPFACGMEVCVGLFGEQVKGGVKAVSECLAEFYGDGGVVRFVKSEQNFLSANEFGGSDAMQICVFGSDERMSLVARFDNLGKGASGAAVQNLNILTGVDETTGLNL